MSKGGLWILMDAVPMWICLPPAGQTEQLLHQGMYFARGMDIAKKRGLV